MAKAYPAKIRLSHGSLSSFCSAGPLSLAPSPRPPYLVAVARDVLRYESYWNGQFWPHTLGSIVSSVTSTSRTNGCRASCLRSKMFVSSASSRIVTPATPASATRARSHTLMRVMGIVSFSIAGAVPDARVTVHAREIAMPPPRSVRHRLHERLVTPHAVLADHLEIARGDLDRLLEVLQCEGRRVPEAVLGLGHPLAEARVGQVALHARRRVPVAALEPAVVLLVHHVAVHAGLRVGGEIGKALGVDEREGPDAGRDPEQAGEEDDHAGASHAPVITTPGGRRPARSPRPGPAAHRSRAARPSGGWWRSARAAGWSSAGLPPMTSTASAFIMSAQWFVIACRTRPPVRRPWSCVRVGPGARCTPGRARA